ncbi:MAG: type II toxin-antitoxin system VapC family toxin [Desulfacinum sp.]|nr:type II toxin-antitoxin system VapC family toxin [Desulfacinum sp.]
MRFLLDTCVLSELLRAVPAQPVVDWIAAQEEVDLCISVLTVGEIHKGAEKVSDPARRMKIRRWLERDLAERFYGRILPIDIQVARVWGTVQAKAEANGRPMPAIDGLIAASAIAHDLTVVTRNTRDMEISGVSLLNPWAS